MAFRKVVKNQNTEPDDALRHPRPQAVKMHHTRHPVLRVIDVVVVVALGISYVQILRFALNSLNPLFPTAASSLHKMAFTGTAALISVAIMFSANSVLTRQNHLGLGLACAAWAYVYFYIIKLWPNPIQVISVFMTGYSAFAFFAFVAAPIIVGAGINRIAPLGGMTQLLAEWRQRRRA